MKIYCLRHGLTELNKQKKVNGEIDEPISPEGIEQAKAAISLIPKEVKYIYTSPMLRARQTAKIINSKLQHSLSIAENLTEIRMGSFAGKAWTDLEGGEELKHKHRSIQFNYQPQGGESAQDVIKRVLEFVKKIKASHDDQEVLIVTHGGIIRTFHFLEHGEKIANNIEHTALHQFDLDKILKSNS